MSIRIKKWQFWVSFFEPLIDEYPEFFPLMIRLYAYEKFKIPSRCLSDSVEFTFESKEWSWSKPRKRECNESGIQVLFDPIIDRSNCLGACRRLVGELQCSSAFLQSSHNPLNFFSSENTIVFRDRVRWFNPLQTMYLVIKLWRHAKYIERNFAVSVLLSAPFIFKCLIIIQCRLKEARRILTTSGCAWFVTPNEQSPLSSIFLIASKMEGVRTGQFLHGMPGRLYVPFWSDEFWVWGSTTKNILIQAGSDRGNDILPVGTLEFSKNVVMDSPIRSASEKNAAKILLFISQVVGDALWGTNAFTNSAKCVAEVASRLSGWKVCVRMHPQAGISEQLIIESIFKEKNVSVVFSHDIALSDDVSKSDFVCSASSSAILEALYQLKPLRLVWNSDLDKIQGSSFLPSELTVTTVNELYSAIIGDRVSADLYVLALDELAGSKDSANRLAEHIESGLINSESFDSSI